MTHLENVQKDGYAIRHIKEQTPELCLAAVKQEGYAIRHITNKTHEICLEAVKQDSYALDYTNPEFKFLFNKEYKGLTLNEIKDLVPEYFL